MVHWYSISKMGGKLEMSKKEGKGLKSFNKGFQVPDTYIIIFLVVVVAALLTFQRDFTKHRIFRT